MKKILHFPLFYPFGCIGLFLSLLFTQNLVAQTTYCPSRGTSPWEQWLERVSLANANGSTTFPTTLKEGYGDFTSQMPANILRGATNLITISPQSSWLGDPRNGNLFWRTWIDLNGDGDFLDADEQVISRQVVHTNSLFLGNEQGFTIPATTRLGTTRMRIAMKFGSFPLPCEVFERGEVEDYTVQITEGVQGQADNSNLRVTNVVGDNRVEPNGQLSVSVTVKNFAALPSRPDSVFISKWRFTGGRGYLPENYAANKVTIPALQANQSVTIPAVFTMPTILSSDVLANVDSTYQDFLEPYFMAQTVAALNSSFPPIQADSVRSLAYFFPVVPRSSADLALTGTQLTTHWDSLNPTVDLRLRLTNNGPSTAKNIATELSRAFTTGNYNQFPILIDFVHINGAGIVENKFTQTGGRDEIGYRIWLWHISELAPGASVEATFRGRVLTEFNAPQTVSFFYKNFDVKHHIRYADVQNSNKSNDTLTYTYRFGRNDVPKIALSIAATPSVFQPFQTTVLRISAKNNATTAFSNIKIELPFPSLTVNGGTATPSVGVWNEWCAGNIRCFEWQIPTLAANATATLDVPIFILNATSPIVATTRLLSSTPTDAANNTTSITLRPFNINLNPAQLNRPNHVQSILKFTVYPSVTSGILTIGTTEIADYQIFNLLGQQVMNGNTGQRIDVSALLKGTYIVKVGLEQAKFVKQ